MNGFLTLVALRAPRVMGARGASNLPEASMGDFEGQNSVRILLRDVPAAVADAGKVRLGYVAPVISPVRARPTSTAGESTSEK
jgi:hypothetical protein